METSNTLRGRLVALINRYADFIRMSNSDIEIYLDKELPKSVGKPYFIPALYEPPTSPKFLEMKSWNTFGLIIHWGLSIALFDLGVFCWLILRQFDDSLMSVIVTLGVVFSATVGAFLWDRVKGRGILFSRREYKERMVFAEATLNKFFGKRAVQWMESRYDTQSAPQAWADFYANFRWKEVEPGHVVVISKISNREPAMKKEDTDELNS